MEIFEDGNNDMLLPVIVAIVCLLVGTYYIFSKPRFPKVLPLDDFQEFPLIQKRALSHDTQRFTFGLKSGHVLGLPVGQHMVMKFTDAATGKPVQRAYTPVLGSGPGRDDEVGRMVFDVKVYKPNIHPKFPNGGKLSQHLDSLKIGETILMRGPKGHMEYFGRGKMQVKPLGRPLEKRTCTAIGMMAGGTGITPMLQILHAIFRDHPNDKTQVKLLYANQSEDDILVREELELLSRAYPDQFQLHYTVDRPPADWKFSTGFITNEMVKEHVYIPGAKKQQFFVCGPPPMIKFACEPAMKALGFTDKDWVVF